jgi:hypothetical protein
VNSGGVEVNDVRRGIRWLLAERAMWTVAVVVRRVLAEDRRQRRGRAESFTAQVCSIFRSANATDPQGTALMLPMRGAWWRGSIRAEGGDGVQVA